AAGDAGLSLGAAHFVSHQLLGMPRRVVMEQAYWGPGFSPEDLRRAVESHRGDADVRFTELAEEPLLQATAQHIARGKIVGWFQGRAEWGPRALGNRSILADPRRAEMKDVLNRRIKHRELFRPFAPSILAESAAEFFEQSHPSPFMTFAYKVRADKRGSLAAPTHIDGTGRLQTVEREANPRY